MGVVNELLRTLKLGLEQTKTSFYNENSMTLSALTKSLPRTLEGALPGFRGMEDLASALSRDAGKDAQILFARKVAYIAVQALWAENLEGLHVPMPSFPDEWKADISNFSSEIKTVIKDLVSLARSGDIAWKAYVVGHCYTCMLPAELRSETGAFHTPPVVAEHLIDTALSQGLDIHTIRVLDPAAGAGAFIIPLIGRVIARSGHVAPELLVRSLSARIHGWELDPFAAWLANAFARMLVARKHGNKASGLADLVQTCDSLFEDPQPTFDLVIANPPYGRIKLDANLRAKFSRSLYGHANLYGLFTDLGIRALAPDGVLALVTPTSFLGGQYFTKLRALLATEVMPVSIEVFGNRTGIFESVLQETALTTYRSESSKEQRCAVSVLTLDDAGEIRGSGRLKIDELPDDGSPWILPRHSHEVALVDCLVKHEQRLADWGYRVKTGPLVWNRHKAQLRNASSKLTVPIIWAESIRPDGTFSYRHEKKNHAPFIELGVKDEWLATGTPCILLQRTTSKEQSRRLLMALLPKSFLKAHNDRVAVENHVNMIIPTVDTPAVPIEILHAFLRTQVVDAAYRCISGSVAVSAYELEALPLPKAMDLESFILAYKAGDKVAMEQEARKLYGFSA